MRRIALLVGGVALASLACSPLARAAEGPEAQKYRVYVGTYTGRAEPGDLPARAGRRLGRADVAGARRRVGQSVVPGRAPEPAVPLCRGRDRRLQGPEDAGRSRPSPIDAASGTLDASSTSSPRAGQGPCFVTVDRAGKNVLVANYGSGSVACLPIGADGRLGAGVVARSSTRGRVADPKRQQGPHAHSINLDAANRFAIAADLGLDKLLVYRFDPAKGTLTPNDPPFARVAPGSGPRHFAFHPDGRHAYVINEITCTVTAFDYDPERGALERDPDDLDAPRGVHGARTSRRPRSRSIPRAGSSTARTGATTASRSSRSTPRPAGSGPSATSRPGGRRRGTSASTRPGRYLLAANQDSGTDRRLPHRPADRPARADRAGRPRCRSPSA